MTVKTLGRALWWWVAALSLISCGEHLGEAAAPAPVSAASQDVKSTNKVLILGSSVSGGLASREARAVATLAPTAQIDMVTPAQWRAMTAQQFMGYRALIIGDGDCRSSDASFQAAVDTRRVWGDIVDGDVVFISTDPTHNNTPLLVENGIKFVLDSLSGHTGMYIALGCAYQNARAPTAVPLLEPFGGFTVQGVPDCADRGHMFEMNAERLSEDITDADLPGSSRCAARAVFTQYPERNFSFAALALSSSGRPIPGQRPYTDFVINPDPTDYVSTPYILVRGAMAVAAGCGLAACPAARECDLGDGLNGQPAQPNQAPASTCSYSCHLNWCGDGHVDTQYGEECDNGVNNGRSGDASGALGTCTSFCKLVHMEPPAHPPVALCRDVTVVADYACTEPASIDNGSYDPDNDLVGCTQSPTGSYGIGSTSVTLTCTDHAGQISTCTGVVTVVDHVAPTVTLNGPEALTLECTKGSGYTDPGATASDICEGPLPVTRTGTVNLGVPGSYPLSYGATDGSGNAATPVSRTVTVQDTLPPQLQVREGPSVLECNASYVDPGATASDLCAGDLTARVTTSGTVNTSQPGQYSVTYRVEDDFGHVSTAVRQLTVGPCGGPSTCVDLHLSDYNLFLLEDYTGGHDVVGKVAVGGNVSLTNFAVGTGLANNDIANALVAGGNLTLKRGAVWGDSRHGGAYSADQTVVYPRGSAARGTPIDFAARFAELRSLSSQLAGMTANGSTVRTSWGGVMLRGTSATVNVFNVDAAAFTGAKLLSIDAPGGSLVVVNIRGGSATFTGFATAFSGGIDQHGVLYNFVDTTSIDAHGFGFWGTVLAPFAHVTFSDGSWDGGLYALSLSGNAEGHINPLMDRNLCQQP